MGESAPTRFKTGNESEESSLHRLLVELLEQADVRIGGDRPWDLRLIDPHVPERVFSLGSLGLGESYMDGHWEVEQLDQFFDKILRAHLDRKVRPLRLAFRALRSRLLSRQSLKQASRAGEVHYDIGNDFYAAMLDSRMTYSCGYWDGAHGLEEAQEARLDLICRKLRLQPGMRLLDIGCGWGSLMGYAAERYGVECVGITVSREQTAWAKARYAGGRRRRLPPPAPFAGTPKQ